MCFKYSDLYQAACSEDFASIIEEWRDTEYLQKILPEIACLDEYIHYYKHHPEGCHGDEWGTPLDHVISAVRVADMLDMEPIEKIAVFFHDIGKGVTAGNFDIVEHPYHNFYNHDCAGVQVFKKVAERLEIPEKETKIIAYCIRAHMNFTRLPKMRKHKIAKIVFSSYWYILKNVCYCDDGARFHGSVTPHYWECANFGDTFVYDNFSETF